MIEWDICISKAHGGVIVTVGCETLVFTCKEKLIEAFALYIRDPKEARKVYCQHPKKNLTEPKLALRKEEFGCDEDPYGSTENSCERR